MQNPWDEIQALGQEEILAEPITRRQRPVTVPRRPGTQAPVTQQPEWNLMDFKTYGEQITGQAAQSAISGINAAISKEMENRRKIAAEQRKRQADAEAEERQRQHELKLEQMRIDALANRLSAYQR